MDDCILERKDKYCYLGILLDEDLAFGAHISSVISNCSQKVFWLSKIRVLIDQKTAIFLFKSLILSRLHYGNIFYLNAKKRDQDRVQKLQNRCLRICTLARRYTSNIAMHREANVLPVYLKCKLDLLKLMYKVAMKQERQRLETNRQTRLQHTMYLPMDHPKTDRFLRSVSYQGPKLWRDLRPEFQNLDTISFNTKLREQIAEEMASLMYV